MRGGGVVSCSGEGGGCVCGRGMGEVTIGVFRLEVLGGGEE